MYTFVLFSMCGSFPKVLAAFGDPREAHTWALKQSQANTLHTYFVYFMGGEALRLGAESSITDKQLSSAMTDMLDTVAR